MKLLGVGPAGIMSVHRETLGSCHRQAELFHWLSLKIPGSALYAPYHHNGRAYLQWMVRGKSLREEMIPFLKRHIGDVDPQVRSRIAGMIQRYRLQRTVILT